MAIDNKKPNAKLTSTDVGNILAALKEGASARNLSFFYSVSVETIRRIRRGDTWTQLTHEEAKTRISDEEIMKSAERVMEQVRQAEQDAKEIAKPKGECPYPQDQWTDTEQRMYQYTKSVPEKAKGWY